MKRISIIVIAIFLFATACTKQGHFLNSTEKIFPEYTDIKYNRLTRGDTVSIAHWKNTLTGTSKWKINQENYKKGDTVSTGGVGDSYGLTIVDSVGTMTIE